MKEGIVYLHSIAAVIVIGLLLYTVLQPKQIIPPSDVTAQASVNVVYEIS
ncbi:hypothetical protein HY490_05490 [Candidatus Woesearchaeota archaeon]|nr:hypothetical protein [Candidatus Woesearchaeota archaeon]